MSLLQAFLKIDICLIFVEPVGERHIQLYINSFWIDFLQMVQIEKVPFGQFEVWT